MNQGPSLSTIAVNSFRITVFYRNAKGGIGGRYRPFVSPGRIMRVRPCGPARARWPACDGAGGSTRHRTACELSRRQTGTSRVGNGGVEAAAPPAIDVRAGAQRSGISAETGGARYGSSVRTIRSRSHSDRPFHSGTASGPPGTDAAVSESADVTGRCLPGPALWNPRGRRGAHAGQRLPNLSPARQQGNTASHAGVTERPH